MGNQKPDNQKKKTILDALNISKIEKILVIVLVFLVLGFGITKIGFLKINIGLWRIIFPLLLGLWLTFRTSEWAVEGLDAGAKYLKQTDYVAGVISSLASNAPEAVLALLFITSGKEHGVLIGLVSVLAAAGFNTIIFGIVVIMGSKKNGFFEIEEKTIFQELVLLRWAFVALIITVFVGIIEHLQYIEQRMINTHIVTSSPSLPKMASLLLVTSYLVYLFYLLIEQRKRAIKNHQQASKPHITKVATIILLGFGIMGIIIGGKVIEISIEVLLEHENIKPLLVALILGGAGSIPEHGIAIISTKTERIEVAIGNILGGILQTSLLIFGLLGLFIVVPLEPFILIQFAATAAVLWFIKVSIQNDHKLDMYEGIMILLLQTFIFLLFFFDITAFT